MSRRPFLPLLCVLLLGVGCTRRAEEPRNVVLISLDTVRADRMSLYGAERPTTPATDALARRGVTFTNAFSPAPWTLPAHAALLTGRYPWRLAAEPDAPLFRLAPGIATVLAARGYDTAAVVGGGFVSATYGADAGFARFGTGGVEQAAEWLETRAAGRPFLLFFHTYAAHLPYRDFRFAGGLDGGRFARLRRSGRKLSLLEYGLTCGGKRYSDEEKEFVRALYDGGIAAADETVGRLVEVLAARGQLERTIVVVTSDHGEEFWDHTDRAAYHGHTLYDELLRVPLVWSQPGLPDPGARVDQPVSLVDILPTLVARLGLPPVPGVDGVDLSPILDGRPLDGERLLFAGATRHGPPRRSVRAREGKLIVNGDASVQDGEGRRCSVPVAAPRELYLPADRAERTNRVAAHADLATRLGAELDAHHRASGSAPRVPAPSLDAATRERLESLGYLE